MADPTSLFEGEPETTQEAIMEATYDALGKHGYADLTIQRIGDEFEKSKSLLYHHYDSKDALLIDFLAFMLERMEANVPIEERDDADEQLHTVFEHVFLELLGESREEFLRAMVELRAQAGHDDAYRERFTMNDAFLHRRLVEIIREGIDQGVFRDVDPEPTASMILTTMNGAMFRMATADDTDLDAVREELGEYLRLRLLADED